MRITLVFVFSLIMSFMSSVQATSIKELEKQAQAGNLRAQMELGFLYYEGIETSQNFNKAVKYFRLAADQGDATAQTYLGYCYITGQGVQQDYKEAVKYFQLAADQGDDMGLNNLATCYEYGYGVPINYYQALMYYKEAAESGNELAEVGLANLQKKLLSQDNGFGSETTITKSYNQSNIDSFIPQNSVNYESKTFAVIIANENYNFVSNAPYACNDGEVLEKYLTCTIGLPKGHVKIYRNASFGNMVAALRYIENLSEAFGKDLNLIFYYAGHGMPDEKTKNPMLIPVDGDVAIPETCYELDKVISTLGGLNAKFRRSNVGCMLQRDRTRRKYAYVRPRDSY